ncbi:MAG: hypothetical protein LBE47_01255 [Methanomassiliicoccaceae archaeon]|jgi:hypothetical protein|nr:hypothetical protein [Methanomassiliicoccaceae archaeon]
MQGRTKVLFVSIVAAVFIVTAVFVSLIISDPSVIEDGDRMFMYVGVYAAVFAILNITLLMIAWRETRSTRSATAKKCVSCGTLMDQVAKVCPKCRAIQPLILNENIYLDPKGRPSDRTVRPKK